MESYLYIMKYMNYRENVNTYPTQMKNPISQEMRNRVSGCFRMATSLVSVSEISSLN